MRRSIVVVLLAVLAAACWLTRRAILRAFFPDGRSAAVVTLLPGAGGADLDPVARVRVVLIDGLSRSAAMHLPSLRSLCADGTDLAVDVGFPTVSLPVQHVLWTGRTQQQAGVQYRISRIDPPPSDALPTAVPSSRAVAESHRDIVHSFGFTTAEPALERAEIEPTGSAWRTSEFEAAAAAAVASDAALAFVHVLRVDEAGHAFGGISPQYRSAAAQADRILGKLVKLAPPDETTRWFVLADHGHLPSGGHGDAEDSIRIVRACIAGGVDPVIAPWPIHLVDLHRALATSLGHAVADDRIGRPLAVAMANPASAATLPRAAPWRVLVALALALAGLAVAVRAGRRMGTVTPAWPLLAYAALVVIHGWPSLSSPPVFPPFARDLLLALAPGFVAAFFGAARSPGRPEEVALALLSLPCAVFLGLCVWVGVDRALLGGEPPLLPFVSAQVSVHAAMMIGGAPAVALGLVLAAWARR